jgi:hypothetical protein
VLTIRSEQMQVFADRVDADFQQRLVTHVAQMFPERAVAMGPTALRLRVRQAVARARFHGFQSERQIASFVDLEFLCGPGMDRRPWALPILKDRQHPPDARIRRLQIAARHHAKGG